jgi:deoxyadenosine/deoxycytidine kinase
MDKHIFVSIMGTMGAGKTTVAQLLAKELDYPLVLENFEQNAFLSRFYDDMKRWAFHSQTFFLLEKVRQLEQIPEALKTKSIIQDTPIMQDVYSYAQAQYELGNMDKDEWKLYLKTYQTLNDHLKQPDVIIYLDASVETLMNRIESRGRAYEQSIPRSYIELLDRLNTEWLKTCTIPVVHIDTNTRDIITKKLDKEFVVISLRHALAQYTR